MDLYTLPETYLLPQNTAWIKKFRYFHRSPLYQVTHALQDIEMETLENINPSAVAPWREREQKNFHEILATQTEAGGCMQIAVSSSKRNMVVRLGGAI